MNFGPAMLPRRPSIILALYILVTCIGINGEVLVSHICSDVSGNADQAVLQVTINNASDIFKVYSFDAAAGDTTKSANRIADTECIKAAAESIVYEFTVTTTDSSHACGITVEDDNGITIVKYVFRIYAYSDSLNSEDDLSFEASCRMDHLTGSSLSTGALDISARGNVVLQRQLLGTYLRVRYAKSKREVDVAKVGDKVFLSVEFYPEHSLGPDLYGSSFAVAFPGIDPVTEPSSSELYILLCPRYKFETVVTVTTKYGSDEYVLEDGSPMKVIIPSDLMGCSDDGVAEITDKGVLIETSLHEIGVIVCSTETGNADCYTAMPDSITGKEYITSSMSAAGEYSELNIVAQVDGTSVTIDIPDHYAHIITLNGTSTSAGGEQTISLDRGMVFHLGQTSVTADRSNVNGYLITADSPVSVITSNRNFLNGHMMTQAPPTSKFDKEYVLLPYNEAKTTFIIQPVETGDTVLTRYLTASTSETHTVKYREFVTLDVYTPCELTADKNIMVTQVIYDPTDTDFETTMSLVFPVSRWSGQYKMYHPEYNGKVQAVFKSTEESTAFRIGEDSPTLFTSSVHGPNGYVYADPLTLGPGSFDISLDETQVVSTFMVLGTYTNSGNAITVMTEPFGYGFSDIGLCVKLGSLGDMTDNDCDGIADEEVCNGVDDDGDSVVDEDCRARITDFSGAVGVRVVNCKVSPDTSFPNDKSNAITGSDGCAVTNTQLFRPGGEFVLQTGDDIGSGTQPKYLYSGDLSLSQYMDQPKLYFKCDIEKYCTASTDVSCQEMCDAGGRKRREDEQSQAVKNISTDIWILPYLPPTDEPTVTETIQRPSSFKACMDNSYVQMSLILLAILMLVSFFTALSFCCLFRRRYNRDKEIERNMYHDRPKQFWRR